MTGFDKRKFSRDLEREVERVARDIERRANNIVATSANDHIRQLENLGIRLDAQDIQMIRREYEEQNNE